jgi:purine-binding chemotaxis protein CheW
MSDCTGAEKPAEKSVETINTEKFLVFSVLEKLYCFPSRLIGEIAIFDTVYPLPLVPSYLLGVVNRYSVPYALFDTGLLFQKSAGQRNKMLIIKDEIDRIAFLIDDIAGITDIQEKDLCIIDRNTDSGELTGVISSSFKWNENDVFVLDVNRIINHVSGVIA